MKFNLRNIFSGLLVICALIVTSLLLKKELFNNKESTISTLNNWEYLIDGGKSIDAQKIYIIEFFDYQCPYCSILDATLDSIKSKFKNKVEMIRYHLPLSIHPLAYRLAIASECAKIQNNFENFHKALMENQYRLNSINIMELARHIGIKDLRQFQACVDEEKTLDIISNNIRLAKEYKINTTPTLIINDKIISGLIDLNAIEEIIKDKLN